MNTFYRNVKKKFKCKRCKSETRPHYSQGLCKICYQTLWKQKTHYYQRKKNASNNLAGERKLQKQKQAIRDKA